MANPVTYAEVTLGVHSVYEEAEVLHGELEQRQLELEEAREKRWQAANMLEQIELDFITLSRADNAELSQTAFEKHIKLVMPKNAAVHSARKKHAEAVATIETRENIVRAVELRIKIRIARMYELGGYLQYLAAAKLAVSAKEV